MKKILQFLLFLGVGVGIMTLLYRSLNTGYQEQCRLDGIPSDQCSLLDKLVQDFAGANMGWLLAVVVAFTLSNVFRAWRWQMLLEPVGYQIRFSNSFLTIILGYFANLGLPRIGEVVRAGSLARYENIPLEKVVGSLVVDRLMDFLCLALVVGLAFILEGGTLLAFMDQASAAGGQPSSGGFFSKLWVQVLLGVGLVSMLLMYLLRERLMQIGLVQKIISMAQGFREGLRGVLKLRRPGLFIAYSLGIWLMFYLQCYFNMLAFGPTAHLTMSAALMVFVFGTLGFIIPSPGGMGTYHALCIIGLSIYGISRFDALSYANIAFFTVQIFYNIVGGVLALILLPILNKK